MGARHATRSLLAGDRLAELLLRQLRAALHPELVRALVDNPDPTYDFRVTVTDSSIQGIKTPTR
jgi:hypothetical protein